MTKHWPSDRVGKAKRDVCIWKQEEFYWWKGECGIDWIYTDGTPTDKVMNYCPKCGNRLMQKG